MNEEKKVKLSDSRVVIMSALAQSGIVTWANLRKAFFGEERAKSNSTTAFQRQLSNLAELNIISKSDDGYSLTEYGYDLMAVNGPLFMKEVKSTAQSKFEAKA
jgi:RIO-like serine/threonine protein kinase